MTELRIDRLSARADAWPDPQQVPRMLEHVAADRLERALREQPLPDGDWCVRRLDVAVELDPDRPLSALETDWADRIVTALRVSLRDGSQDVVRFVRPEDAVDDLLAGLATGRPDRVWAWRQLGLIEPGDPEPLSDPATVGLRVLGRLPHGRVAAVARLVARVGVPAVHRLLGGAGWVRLATLVALEAGTTWTPTDETDVAPSDGSGATAGPAAADATGPSPADRRTGAALATAITGTGGLAPALRASGLRVDPITRQAWAVLAIGAADPSLLRPGSSRPAELVAAVGDLLQPTAGPGLAVRVANRQPRPTPPAGRVADHVPVADHPSDAVGDATNERAATPGAGYRQAPEVNEQLQGRHSSAEPRSHDAEGLAGSPTERATSSWGGLLYLLNSAADAGLPGALGEPPFLARPAPWVMHRIGMALVPLEPDDPALLAFAGVPEWEPQPPPDDAEQLAITACARRWAAVTARRLLPGGVDRSDEPTDAEVVLGIARRVAVIAQEPGWVEVRLLLDEVDLDVRRAGLDVDPGWVWWLGHVVRFRYE